MTKLKDKGEPDAKALREEAARLGATAQASVLLAAADRLEALAKVLEDDRSMQRVWSGIGIAAGAIVVVGIAHYFRLMLLDAGWNRSDKFGQLGDALGPIAGLMSALAVGVALWSVRLQSRELALQRQEMKDTRTEMREQAEHLKKAAAAQDRLAHAQGLLAAAQVQANELAKVQIVSASLQSHIQTEVSYFEIYAAHAMDKSVPLRQLFDLAENEPANPGVAKERLFERLREARAAAKQHGEAMATFATRRGSTQEDNGPPRQHEGIASETQAPI